MGKSFFRVGARLGIMMSGNEDDIRSDGDESNVISRCLPKTWCHQCKMRKQRVTACDNFFSSDKEVRCNGRYCDACIQRHYLEDANEFSDLEHWLCYRCTSRCTCAACKRRRKADEEGEELLEVEPRKRETRRFKDEVILDEDYDFEPRAKRREAPVPVTVPRPAKRRTGGMSALALLAEESLTTEFVPAGEQLDIVKEHTAEIARLKELCRVLQQQVTQISLKLEAANAANAANASQPRAPVAPRAQVE